MKLSAFFLGLVLAGTTCAQDVFGTDERAFVLMPAETVCSGPVQRADFSYSGRWIVYQRQVGATLNELFGFERPKPWRWFAYDRQSKASKSLAVPEDAETVSVMGDDATVFVQGEKFTSLLSLATGKVTPLQIPEEARWLSHGERSSGPMLLLELQHKYSLIYPNGSSSVFSVDPSIDVSGIINSDAQNVYFFATVGKGKSRKNGQVTVGKVNGNVSFKELTEAELQKIFETMFPGEDGGPFDVLPIGGSIQAMMPEEVPTTGTPVKQKVPTTIPSRAIVGPGSHYSRTTKVDAILYCDAGALLFREVKPIDPKIARRVSDEALRRKLLSQAKQVGTGFLIYAADYDDVLPGQEGWEDKINPYVKNRELMNGFNYTFRGGDITKIEDPSKAEMGFVMGPGGRAVVYLDGSARWIANP